VVPILKIKKERGQRARPWSDLSRSTKRINQLKDKVNAQDAWEEDYSSFQYWYRKYKNCQRWTWRYDFQANMRYLPSYEKEDYLFSMAAMVANEWERMIVIECFLKEYGQTLLDRP
jgi:hypothetical protein